MNILELTSSTTLSIPSTSPSPITAEQPYDRPVPRREQLCGQFEGLGNPLWVGYANSVRLINVSKELVHRKTNTIIESSPRNSSHPPNLVY